VFAASLVPKLKSLIPGSFVGIWCKSYASGIAPLIPGLGACHAADPFWDRSPGRGQGPLAPFLRSWLEVRRAKYDAALLASQSSKTAAAVALAGVPRRIGFHRPGTARWLTDALPAADPGKPVLTQLSRLLEPLGLQNVHLACSLNREPLAQERLRLRPFFARRTTALHPFAGAAERCVALAEWIRLSNMLEDRGVATLWFGTATELNRVRSAPNPRPSWNYADDLTANSLFVAAAALSLCDVFVGHDSGPLHLANALGIPCLGVYAPGEPERTPPQAIGPARIIAKSDAKDVRAEDMLAEWELVPASSAPLGP